MPRSGSGAYTKPSGTTAITLTTILSGKFNELMDDFATEMTASLSRSSGTGAMSRNLPMGANRITGLAAATARDDAPQIQQVLNNAMTSAVDTGVADAYKVTLSPDPQNYTTFMEFWFTTSNTNTGASTINVNSLGTKAIKQDSGTDLIAGAISTTRPNHVIYDGTQFILNSSILVNAVKSTDTSTSGWAFVIDDDTMATASATTLSSSESIKTYVDTEVLAAVSQSWARIEWDRTGVQSIPDATYTTVEYDGTTTSGGVRDFLTGAPAFGFKIPTGVTRIGVRLRGLWQFAAAGFRKTAIVETSPTPGIVIEQIEQTAENSSPNTNWFDEIISVTAGDEYVMRVYQDSGGPLNYGTTNALTACYLEIVDLTPGSPSVSEVNWAEYDLGTYAVSTVYTQAHGLTAYPEEVQVYLECDTTDNGYAVGDRVLMNSHTTAEDRLMLVQVDTTNIRVITGGTPIIIVPKTGGTQIALTVANWSIVARVK